MTLHVPQYTYDNLLRLVPEFKDSIEKLMAGRANSRVQSLANHVAFLRSSYGIEVLYKRADGELGIVNPVLIIERLQDLPNAGPVVDAIRELHVEREAIFDQMHGLKATSRVKLRRLARRIEAIEYELQSFWSFPLDAGRHQWHRVPHCKCEQVVHSASWTREWKISPSCPIHGSGEYEVGVGWLEAKKKNED
jgi:hypothetical protein